MVAYLRGFQAIDPAAALDPFSGTALAPAPPTGAFDQATAEGIGSNTMAQAIAQQQSQPTPSIPSRLLDYARRGMGGIGERAGRLAVGPYAGGMTPEQLRGAGSQFLLRLGAGLISAGAPGSRTDAGQAITGAMQGVQGGLERAAVLNQRERQMAMEAQKVVAAQRAAEEARKSKRKTAKDAAGFLRYVDTGERVFPGVEKPVEAPKPPSFSDLSSTRSQFRGDSKAFVSVRDAYKRLRSAATNASPAGDVALIFNFMKMIDPGSTVREGEFATAQQTAGIPGQIVARYNQLVSGERLTPGQRMDFLKQAENVFAPALESQRELEGEYSELAQRHGINPDDVTIDYIGRLRGWQPAVQEPAVAPEPAPPPMPFPSSAPEPEIGTRLPGGAIYRGSR